MPTGRLRISTDPIVLQTIIYTHINGPPGNSDNHTIGNCYLRLLNINLIWPTFFTLRPLLLIPEAEGQLINYIIDFPRTSSLSLPISQLAQETEKTKNEIVTHILEDYPVLPLTAPGLYQPNHTVVYGWMLTPSLLYY